MRNEDLIKLRRDMSIDYRVVSRKNPQTGETLYHASSHSRGYVDVDQLAEAISAATTVTEADIKGILSSLEQHIGLHLSRNESVRLGDLGSFHIRTRCRGAESADELSEASIKAVRVHFRKSARMNRALRVENIEFRQVD